ncbi:hypothetical protein FRC17_009851, partial [Serendipita sp. 399]
NGYSEEAVADAATPDAEDSKEDDKTGVPSDPPGPSSPVTEEAVPVLVSVVVVVEEEEESAMTRNVFPIPTGPSSTNFFALSTILIRASASPPPPRSNPATRASKPIEYKNFACEIGPCTYTRKE